MGCPNDCSGKGDCNDDGTCYCLLGWFAKDCSRNAKSYHLTEWNSLVIVMACIFGTMAILSMLQMVLLFLQKKKTGIFRKCVIICVAMACTIRCVWFVVDPFSFKGILPMIAESILYQIIPGLIATAFNFIISFWINLLKITAYNPLRCWCPPIQVVLLMANASIWVLLIPFSIAYRLMSVRDADLLLSVYILYFSGYLLLLAIGFLTFGLRIYYSFVSSVGIANIRNPMVNKITVLAVVTSVISIITIISLLLGASWAVNLDGSPGKFILFQMAIYRVEELMFCFIVLVLAGDWNLRRWLRKNYWPSIASINGDDDDDEDFTGETHGLTDPSDHEGSDYKGSYYYS